MMIKKIRLSPILLILLTIIYVSGCSEDTDIAPEEEVRVGFELVQIVSFDSVLIWVNQDVLTEEQFDSIDLTTSWRKNEPREGMPDFARFLRSPDADQDGEFTIAEHFGYKWLFNAQVVDFSVPLPGNDEGMLTGRYIGKYHEVTFNAGRTLSVLVSPENEEYILISRDKNRATDIPEIPDGWQIEERQITEELVLELPNPTLNIRAENNQDSWQGPVEL